MFDQKKRKNQWPKYSYLQSIMKIIDLAKYKDCSHFHVNSSESLAVDTKNKFGQIQFQMCRQGLVVSVIEN